MRVLLLLPLLLMQLNLWAGRCTGSPYCTACSNCSSCKYCSVEGGTCGVCSGHNGNSRNKGEPQEQNYSKDSKVKKEDSSLFKILFAVITLLMAAVLMAIGVFVLPDSIVYRKDFDHIGVIFVALLVVLCFTELPKMTVRLIGGWWILVVPVVLSLIGFLIKKLSVHLWQRMRSK
jgi:hypothetical protein